jgi:lysophospholipase L1-like esterase
MIRLKYFYYLYIILVVSCNNFSDYTNSKNTENSEFAEASSPKKPRVVFFGDSLTYGQGIKQEQNFFSLIKAKLRDENLDLEMFNKAQSGMTTAEAMDIYENALTNYALSDDYELKFIFICLGANDLFQKKLAETEKNLSKMIKLAKLRGLTVLLSPPGFPYQNFKNLSTLQNIISRLISPNYLDDIKKLDSIYQKLASEDVVLLPALMKPIPLGKVGFDNYYMVDLFHPNELGHQLIAEAFYPHFKNLLIK